MPPKLTLSKPRLSCGRPSRLAERPKTWGGGRGGRPWQRLRNQILLRDQYTCQHCGKVSATGMEVDHIINVARGGSDDESNLQTLCRECHRKKTQSESRGEA